MRWRRVDLAQGAQEEPGVPVSRQAPGRDLRAMGVAIGVRHGGRQALRPPAARRTARRGHRGVQQNVCDVVDHIRTQCGGKPIELRVQDDARIGQKTGRVRIRARKGTSLAFSLRIRARKGTRPRWPAGQRYKSACLFGAVCADRETGAALMLP